MLSLKSVSVPGVLVGFVTVVASSIVFSLLSLVIFSGLVESGGDDVLMTSTGPLSYALGVLAVSTVLGVVVCSKLSGMPSPVNTIGVIVAYGAFAYLLSRSPSNAARPYPEWFVVASYLILVPSAIVGHLLSARRREQP